MVHALIEQGLVDEFWFWVNPYLWPAASPTTLPVPGGRSYAVGMAYRDRGPERVEPGRLGSATWGTGRGAAPPRFGPDGPRR